MKIRQGFVSNSSSCSFTCCGCLKNINGDTHEVSNGPLKPFTDKDGYGYTICRPCLNNSKDIILKHLISSIDEFYDIVMHDSRNGRTQKYCSVYDEEGSMDYHPSLILSQIIAYKTCNDIDSLYDAYCAYLDGHPLGYGVPKVLNPFYNLLTPNFLLYLSVTLKNRDIKTWCDIMRVAYNNLDELKEKEHITNMIITEHKYNA